MSAEVHALAGAYVLDALPGKDARAFRDHLDHCRGCRDEVAELRITATQLGLAAAERPPDGLEDRVLHATRRTRQVPPPVVSHARRRLRGRGWLPAAAAVLVLVVGGGGFTVGRLVDDPAPAEVVPAVAAVVSASDARTTTASLRGGGRLTVIASAGLGRAVAISEDLPQLPPEQVYQLWLVGPQGTARSADVLIASSPRPPGPLLLRGLGEEDQVAITREPAGGSEQPTMTPLAVV